MLKETGVPEIEKAVVILHKMSADEEMKEIARLREKTLLDEESAKDYYLSLGEARGEVKGEAKKEAEIIKKLLKSGMTEEQIQKILNS